MKGFKREQARTALQRGEQGRDKEGHEYTEESKKRRRISLQRLPPLTGSSPPQYCCRLSRWRECAEACGVCVCVVVVVGWGGEGSEEASILVAAACTACRTSRPPRRPPTLQHFSCSLQLQVR